MTVELAIVGIRNYLANGAEDYPKLFARLPIGSVVYLRKEPTGSTFPGSISVWDDNNQQIGSISKTDRRFIELAIPEGEMLPAKICGHSAEHNCMYAKAENQVGFSQPYIREILLTEGETVFPLTAYDQKILQLTSLMKTKIKMLKDGIVGDTDSLLTTAHEYAEYCCMSLDGETSFNRDDILRELKSLSATYAELKEVYSRIFEQTKDLGKKGNELKTQVYLQQFQRIKKKALSHTDKVRSHLEDYYENLRFTHGGVLSKGILSDEILNLSALLANEMMRGYEKYTESEESFATALYSLNYSMQGIYRLYTRQIKLEYLKERLSAVGAMADDGTGKIDAAELCHFIYPGLVDDAAQIVHRQIADLVKRFTFKEICFFLKKLADEEKILLPQIPQVAFDELHRMGLPPEETKGFGYDNFCKYYKEIK